MALLVIHQQDICTRDALQQPAKTAIGPRFRQVAEQFAQDWTFGVLYAGLMAVPDSTGGKKYRDAMLGMGNRFHWQLGMTTSLPIKWSRTVRTMATTPSLWHKASC